MKKVIIILTIIISFLIINGYFINTNTIKVRNTNISISNLPSSFKGFQIMQISDLLISSKEDINKIKKITTLTNNEQVDIIVFTGDIFANNYTPTSEDITSVTEIFKSLNCNLYKYAVIGDNDQKDLNTFTNILTEANFQILDNKSIYLFNKDKLPIKISGITTLDNLDNTLTLEENYETALNLCLTHYPDYADLLSEENTDIILSGHSLGGQIKLPFYGGILKQENAQKYLNNEYTINNTKLFVSNGIGTHKIKFRLFNPPEINLYTLY